MIETLPHFTVSKDPLVPGTPCYTSEAVPRGQIFASTLTGYVYNPLDALPLTHPDPLDRLDALAEYLVAGAQARLDALAKQMRLVVVPQCLVCGEEGHTYVDHLGLLGRGPAIYPGMPSPVNNHQTGS